MLKHRIVFIAIFQCIFISACATKLSYESPDTVNLSGDWVLNKTLSQEIVLPAPTRAANGPQSGGRGGNGRGNRGGERPEGRTARRGGPNSTGNKGNIRPAKPNAMTSVEMTIEQAADSMGIRYQNEQYRDINWGEHEYRGVTTTAGWEEETLRVETNGKRLNFSERYHLDSTGKILTITFSVANGEFFRVYDKKHPSEASES